MIIINNLSGQLGNRLLRLNNALQLSKKTNQSVKFRGKDEVTREIEKYFEFDLGNKRNGKKSNKILTKMGKLFYENEYDPKELLKIKKEYQIELNKDKTNIGIHLRYQPDDRGIFFNREDILKEYYINAIKYCVNNLKNPNFIIFGPISSNQFRFHKKNDVLQMTAFLTNFKFYKDMIKYLKENGISFEYSITIKNSKEIYIKDFIQMSNCDVIISSHSTFNICAGYLTKTKKIIHSKKFLDYFLKNKDKFWVELYNGGNEYYKIWKLI